MHLSKKSHNQISSDVMSLGFKTSKVYFLPASEWLSATHTVSDIGSCVDVDYVHSIINIGSLYLVSTWTFQLFSPSLNPVRT